LAKGKGSYGNFGGGMPGNMNNLLKQAQKMQRQMEETQAALEDEVVSASAGGGAVEISVSGKKMITSVKIDKDVLDPDDVEMLEDLVMAAANEALWKMEELSRERMSRIAEGMGSADGLFQ
jgi:DNA-binding YbaB/EbfC family protein